MKKEIVESVDQGFWCLKTLFYNFDDEPHVLSVYSFHVEMSESCILIWFKLEFASRSS